VYFVEVLNISTGTAEFPRISQERKTVILSVGELRVSLILLNARCINHTFSKV